MPNVDWFIVLSSLAALAAIFLALHGLHQATHRRHHDHLLPPTARSVRKGR